MTKMPIADKPSVAFQNLILLMSVGTYVCVLIVISLNVRWVIALDLVTQVNHCCRDHINPKQHTLVTLTYT